MISFKNSQKSYENFAVLNKNVTKSHRFSNEYTLYAK